jgi:transcriptional regulator with XRE-family HTH domain
MSIVATLLDKARARRGIPTDMALAERLGRSRAVVSEWRAGKSYPDEDLIVALAELAGDDAGEWLLAIKAIRTDGKAGKVWAALAKRLAATAAMLLCAVGFSGAMPGKAHAASVSADSSLSEVGSMPIM